MVAIIDSGIAYENFNDPNGAFCADSYGYYECISPGMFYAKAPDFSQTTFVSGYDFINSDSHPNDDDGHGTHVAGTVAESTNNISKSAGLAFNVSIMPIKVLAAMGSGGDTAKAASGIDYAREHGADVINLSLGSDYDSQMMREAIQHAVDAGIVIVAATGNESTRSFKANVIYPAAYAGVIAVGAVRVDEMRADYSNYGSALDLMAPGGQFINDEGTWFQDQDSDSLPDGIVQETLDFSSTFDPTKFTAIGPPEPNTGLRCVVYHSGYYWLTAAQCGLFQGTSMASPHVAAAAALMLSQDSTLSSTQVCSVLEDTAKDLGPSGWDEETGYGLLNLEAALNAVSQNPDFKMLLSHYNTAHPEADLNNDGIVNGLDFGEMVKLIQ